MSDGHIASVEARHVNALLNMLDAHASGFLSADESDVRPWRLYFVDADILSVYTNGRTKSPISSWSSLLSLSSHARGAEASSDTASLANVTGQAVVRYIFGALLKSAILQRGRIYITPEHEREFKSIVLSIIHSESSGASEINALKTAYLELADTERPPSVAFASASEIVQMLEDRAMASGADRAYALLKDTVSKLSTNLIVQPAPNTRTVLFSAEDPTYLSLIESSRETVWSAYESALRIRISGADELLMLKRRAFDLHDAAGGAERPYRYFSDRISGWISSNEAPKDLRARQDLEYQVLVSIRHAADLSALIRILALRKWLDLYHPAPEDRRWEMVLISGSAMLQRTLKALQQQVKASAINIVHPLAMLRHVDLWDPAGVLRLREAGYTDQPHEFALSKIFGNGSNGSKGTKALEVNADGPELDAFLRSFREQLELVVSREAITGGDRSLTRLRAMLEDSIGFDPKRFVETLRDLVTQRYAQTFNRLVELFPGEIAQLPASSLPSLDLPRSASAMTFLRVVRERLASGQDPHPFVQLDVSLKEDRSAYSALLALATGYMARGQQWIPQAQSMAATATLLAKGRGNGSDYPEGNEALYLEAFLLRMSLTLESNSQDFSIRHKDMIQEAQNTLTQWQKTNVKLAEERLGQDMSAPSRVEWIRFRYDLENNAREVFIVLAEHLKYRNAGSQDIESLEKLATQSLALHELGAELANSNSRSAWEEQYEPSLWFNGIQAALSVLQSWLIWREATEMTGANQINIINFERRIADKVAEMFKHRAKLGKVVPLLAKIYAQRAGLAREWTSVRVSWKDYSRVRFAGIDKQRIEWLREATDVRSDKELTRTQSRGRVG